VYQICNDVLLEELILTASTSCLLKWYKSVLDEVMFISSIQLTMLTM